MVTFVHAGFRVDDYDEWKKGFDASLPQRQIAGEVSYQVLHSVDDDSHLTVVSVLKNVALVKAFMNAPNYIEMMKASGVSELGQRFLLEEVDSGTH